MNEHQREAAAAAISERMVAVALPPLANNDQNMISATMPAKEQFPPHHAPPFPYDQEEELQVLSEAPALLTRSDSEEQERLLRKKRRRKLKRMIQRSQGFPSFFSLLTVNYDNNEEDDEDEDDDMARYVVIVKQEETEEADEQIKPDPAASTSTAPTPFQRYPPKRVRVDVDEALAQIKMGSSPALAIRVDDDDDVIQSAIRSKRVTLPADEGWYEGIVSPMSILPEDEIYLPPLQVWTRRNLELFSATIQDASLQQAGRRSIGVGRVGVRCIHCAAAMRHQSGFSADQDHSTTLVAPDAAPVSSSAGGFTTNGGIPDPPSLPPPSAQHYNYKTKQPTWPVGALSYPANATGLHAICSQKTALHFENKCPFLPPGERLELQRLVQQQQQQQPQQQHTLTSSSAATRTGHDKVSLSLYYLIAAKRIGLVDVPDDGIRFGRDLSLEPLPFDTIRRQCEQQGIMADTTAAFVGTAPRITADQESERVLAEAVAEKDDLTRYLCTSHDKAMVTDFLFLTIRQMAVCHASPWDLNVRGKKTRGLRLGLAGFCCRHCASEHGGPPASMSDTSRSYASQPDNLVSAISSSFASHLQRCYKVPLRIKKALAAYKRIHQRQIAQLPHGAQRKLVNELWARMRNADKTVDEMQKILQAMPEPTPAPPPPLFVAPVVNAVARSSRPSAVTTTSTSTDGAIPTTRPEHFPICEDPETKAVIAKFENEWDADANDGLIRPSDRNLVSDFVFLTMRQIQATLPQSGMEAISGKRLPRLNVAGLSCVHCGGKEQQVSPSGLSFPTAPDNYASCLNTGFYNHMQNCYYIPNDLKRALSNTRKIHSLQCSSLRFGSQRKYFNMLFARICDFYRANVGAPLSLPTELASSLHSDSAIISGSHHQGRGSSAYSFLQVSARESSSRALYLCSQCRMVPIQFRAEGSIFYGKPKDFKMKEHCRICKKDGLVLSRLAVMLEEMVQNHCNGAGAGQVIMSDSFRNLVRTAVGGNERLTELFTAGVLSILDGNSSEENVKNSGGLWLDLSSSEIEFEQVADAFGQFASDYEGLSGRSIRQCPKILGVLQLISPSLAIIGDEETSSGANEDHAEAATTTPPKPPPSPMSISVVDEEYKVDTSTTESNIAVAATEVQTAAPTPTESHSSEPDQHYSDYI